MKKILFAVTLLILVGISTYLYFHFGTSTATSGPSSYIVPMLTQSYTNTTYNFSLMMPADFSASESSDSSSGADIIVLQDTSGDGIEITVSPFSEDTGNGYTLTAARIEQDLPDLEIDDQQSVTVGPHYTGLAFLSNNPAFDGQSREVWFVFHGNLYQISTYARLDSLLQAIFKTWQFS